MMASMITGTPDPEDVRKYFRALRRAQRDIDLRPELYTHYYKKEFPVRFHEQMDTRRWGPGERLVFEPYSKETFEQSFEWIEQHGIFPRSEMGGGKYEAAIFPRRRGDRSGSGVGPVFGGDGVHRWHRDARALARTRRGTSAA